MLTVRKSLATLRTKWKTHAPETPMYFNEKLVETEDETLADFCVQFVMNQKRVKINESSTQTTTPSTTNARPQTHPAP